MNKIKKAELNRIHKQFFDAGTGNKLSQPLDRFVDENVYGFGTAIDEKVSGLTEFKKLLNNQKKQSKGIDIKWKMKPLHCFISEDENNVVFSDEVCLSVATGDEHIRKYFRFSVIMNYINNHWKVIHWHASAPEQLESEKDTFGINEWKQKTIVLERIVAERTSELSEKNRELEIESSLERVRAATLSMKDSSEIGKVIFYLYREFTKLDAKLDRCFIMIVDPDTRDITWWLSGKEGLLDENGFLVQNNDYPSHKMYLRYWKNRKKKWQYILQGKEKKDWDKFEFSKTGLANLPDGVKKDMASVKKTYLSGSSDSFGCILSGSLEPLSDEHQEIISRFTVVFNQTYTRFRDLQKAETQTREAQIEVALERVRARAMAMQNSDELNELIGTVFTELTKLDLALTRSVIWVFEPETNAARWWMANGEEPSNPMNFYIKYHEHPAYLTFVNEWKNQNIKFVYDLNREDKIKWDKILFNETELANLPDVVKNGMKAPERVLLSASFNNFGGINVASLEPLSDEHFDILLRFAKVFDLTYTRFLDLQKAEAQARESQIQLALERVRARTMAMQKSSELLPTANLLFDQLKQLGAELQGVAFAICDKNSTMVQKWTSIGVFSHPYNIDPGEERMYEAWKNQSGYYEEVYEGEKQKKYYESFMEIPAFRQGVEKFINSGHPIPTWQKNHAVTFQHGYLLFITTKPFNETQIFLRFGKVFDQTYTRFLDLQKAEAQAREAQIEAALEKVRSRSLSVFKSSEFEEVVMVIFERLKELDVPVGSTIINIFKDGSKDLEAYGCGESEQGLTTLHHTLSYFNHPAFQDLFQAHEMEIDYFSKTYSEEEKNSFYEYEFINSGLKNLPEDAKQQIIQSKGLRISAALSRKSMIMINDYGGKVLNEKEADILKRFSKVFEQAYIRFLDLQKAEAQAREAQIEAALERVRSRTLAMQKSDELAETSAVLFQQLILLGIEPNRLYISVIKDNNGETEFWITDEDGSKVSMAYEDNLNNNSSFKKMFAGWKKQQKSLIIDMKGEELQDYFKYLNSIHVPFKGGMAQQRRLQYIAYFNKGFIGMASPDEQPEETMQLLERFAGVFNLTFTRFNDLKVAEAHAMQAEQDLVEIKAARKNAEEALTELKSTQKQLIQSEKMASLGELTAGIAHEIQNPLNFVNNFSEVSNELMDEMNEELDKGEIDEAKAIAGDIKSNLEKINHHGKRADAIMKGMLQHSRSSSGQKELTDINALCDEYLRLAFHGMRAKDKSFNAIMETKFDDTIGKINVVPQDIGRVLLNIINNAFFACTEGKRNLQGFGNLEGLGAGYSPTVTVSTKKDEKSVIISVRDNGNGIPEKIKDKIFQPFFTTKPTGQGTGLGLSLAYDIVKAHGGEVKVESKEGEGTELTIQLPA